MTEKNTFDPMSLSELDANPISKFVNQKKAGFVFKMLIPDPDPSISLPATQLTQATQMGGEVLHIAL